MSLESEFTEKLVEAFRRIVRADGKAEGWLDGDRLDLATSLTRDQAAELMFGMQMPAGFRMVISDVGPREE